MKRTKSDIHMDTKVIDWEFKIIISNIMKFLKGKRR